MEELTAFRYTLGWVHSSCTFGATPPNGIPSSPPPPPPTPLPNKSCVCPLHSNRHFHSAVVVCYFAVPLGEALPSLSPQKKLSSTLDIHVFHLFLDNASTTDRARLHSVASVYASSWLSVIPSEGLCLHLDPPVFQVAIK